ncbi:unnamed protein product [Rhizoctonia solani]|uniref:Uncharacterized protein n=1 Tax=Rhizoctonia solani TaxID=456999 RepID=A0A8H3GN64_9AGAM|nr:unnamed protein product [Rhizoctonia solani]
MAPGYKTGPSGRPSHHHPPHPTLSSPQLPLPRLSLTMKFTRLVSFVAAIVSASVLVAAAPVPSAPPRNDYCSGCNYGERALSLVTTLQVEVSKTLILLDDCRNAGSNPTDLFIHLAAKVDECNSAVAAVGVDDLELVASVRAQVSNIAAKIILDISTGCSKFQDVKIENFNYVALSAKIDVALKGLCISLDVLIQGFVKLVSSICLPNAVLLVAANLRACLSIFANISLTLY